MEKVLQFLRLVYPISPNLQDYLVSHIKSRELSCKEMLLKAGHVCQNIYFIEKGLLRCFYIKKDVEICTWFMKENELLTSIVSFYQRTVSNESIQALEYCVVHYISYEELSLICRAYPEFNLAYLKLMFNYLIQANTQLHGLRISNCSQRYQWFLENYPKLISRVPAKYLASWLRMCPSTLWESRKIIYTANFSAITFQGV